MRTRSTAIESPSLLDYLTSVSADEANLSEIQTKKADLISKIETLGDQVLEIRKVSLARVLRAEEAFLNRIRLAQGAHREIGTISRGISSSGPYAASAKPENGCQCAAAASAAASHHQLSQP